MGRCILQGSQKDDSYVFLNLLHYRSTLFRLTFQYVAYRVTGIIYLDKTVHENRYRMRIVYYKSRKTYQSLAYRRESS